ncbi:permease [Streptococcus dentiloxodontae]
MVIFNNLPDSVLQLLAVFLSIIIEALPFVLLGSVFSGFIEIYITPEKVQRFLPKNKILAILFGTFAGFIFPSCECGIVPIITRFLEKKVPSYTAIPFMATAPIINPIVLFATYTAFGNSWYYVSLRLLGAFIIAVTLGILLGFAVNPDILKTSHKSIHRHDYSQLPKGKKFFEALVHAIDEFFDTGRYLVFGSLVAATMQIYVPTRLLTTISHNSFTAILIMMLLAFILSLCSEADAFIGASFLSTFGSAPTIAFLLIGPMVDIKNLLMMTHHFKTRFVLLFVSVASFVTIVYCLAAGVL